MSLKSIDSDDLTAFSSASSSNMETDTATDGVGDFLKDEASYTQQISSHQGLTNSLYNSLFKADSRPGGNGSSTLMTSTNPSSWVDLVGKASCSSQSSPSPTRAKGSSDSNHSGMINWISMVSNQNGMMSNQNSPASVVSEDSGTPDISQPSSFIAGMSSPKRKQYSSSYNHEPYSLPSCSQNRAKSHTMGLQDARPSYADVGAEYAPFSLSADCFNAAINEDSVPKNSRKTDHISKVKQLKFHPLSSNVYNKDQKPSASNRNNPPADSKMFTTISSQGLCKKSYTCSNGTITKTTFSTVTTPYIPNAGQAFPNSSLGPNGQRVLNPDLKKHRYNQTALALQQSGLMKTTMKTAELLRKSKVLQQELFKLRKEAAVFMHSVLNNPENEHLKELYLPKKESPPSNS